MRINPITADEANEQSVGEPWPAGDYDFKVHEASEGISNAGNEQIKLTLHVYNRQGNQRIIFDYLSSSPKGQWKVRHFAEAVGMLRMYETGDMPVRDMIDRPGRCKLRIRPAEGQFSAQNAVADYLVNNMKQDAGPPQARTPAPASKLDDEIPF